MAPSRSWSAETSSGSTKRISACGSRKRRVGQPVAVRFTWMRFRVTHFMLCSRGRGRLAGSISIARTTCQLIWNIGWSLRLCQADVSSEDGLQNRRVGLPDLEAEKRAHGARHRDRRNLNVPGAGLDARAPGE